MPHEIKRIRFGQPKYIPYPRGEQEEYQPPKTDINSLSMAELRKNQAKFERPLVFDENVLRSFSAD
ncbi:MAG: hypothetical protein JRI50_11485 [Deltaproteobacteria bacterium]|nr:hypothetical protein [Deltaproteobacteria bacterium]